MTEIQPHECWHIFENNAVRNVIAAGRTENTADSESGTMKRIRKIAFRVQWQSRFRFSAIPAERD